MESRLVQLSGDKERSGSGRAGIRRETGGEERGGDGRGRKEERYFYQRLYGMVEAGIEESCFYFTVKRNFTLFKLKFLQL